MKKLLSITQTTVWLSRFRNEPTEIQEGWLNFSRKWFQKEQRRQDLLNSYPAKEADELVEKIAACFWSLKELEKYMQIKLEMDEACYESFGYNSSEV